MSKRAQINFGSIDGQKNKIVLKASQGGRFLKIVDSQLRKSFGKKKAEVARGYVNDAIDNIKSRLNSGFDGASTSGYHGYRGGHVDTTITPSGKYGSSAARLSVSWDDLAQGTVQRKFRERSIGRGKFWLDRGKMRSSGLVTSMKAPKVTYRTYVFADSTRRKGSKDNRIDFEVIINLGEMNFPFDDMVRRPLVSGERGSSVPSGVKGTEIRKLLTNEYGGFVARYGYEIPARPWIEELSANIGNAMFEDLLTNK